MMKGLQNVRSVKSGLAISGKTRRFGMIAVFAPLFLFTLALLFPPYFGQNTNAAPGTATESVLTYTSINDTASVSLGVTSPLGTFASSLDGTNDTTDQRAKFSISTNNYTGYTVSMTSSSINTNLTETENTEPATISSISSPVATALFSGSDTASQALNNQWGFKPNYYNSNANTDTYYPMLTSQDNVLIRKTDTANSVDGIANADEYTLSLGLRADFATKQGTYTNEAFIIEYVANPDIFATTVDFAGVGVESVTFSNDTYGTTTVNNSGEIVNLKYGITYTLEATLATNHELDNWASVNGTLGSTTTNPTTYTITDANILADTITVTGIKIPSNITFNAGANINTIIVADSSNNYYPYYITPSAPKTFTDPTPGTKYIVTVVPEANYKLSSWSGDITNLASTTLLTTTYTVPDASATLTATGETGSYPSMKNFTAADCATATNVTDVRDGKSYTVAPFTNTTTSTTYCYMLNNLRLDSTTDGTTQRVLTSDDSDITPNETYSTFPMPTGAWVSSAGNASMQVVNNDYYYNWFAAKANPYSTDITPTEEEDNYSLGSICPAGWTLPDYDTDIKPAMLWSNGSNIGNLYSNGRNGSLGGGYWWSGDRGTGAYPYHLLRGIYATRASDLGMHNGMGVRCMAKNS